MNDQGEKIGPKPIAWPVGSLETLGKCPLCGKAARRLLHDDLEDRLFCAPGCWTLYACAACGAAYLDPRPTRTSIHRAYNSYFTHGESIDDPGAPMSGGLASLRQVVKRQYFQLRFGPAPDPFGNALCLPLFLIRRLRAALNGSMRHLPRPRVGNTLLDIGCGSGRFMALARAVGWTCVGTEVDPLAAARARARGFDVHLGDAGELVAQGRRFHAITISHVIEHVHEPLALLRSARHLLHPGGFFWIETPNIDSHGHDCFGRHWRGLEPPRHLQIFNHEALQLLLTKAGFVDIRFAPWQLDWVGIARSSLALAEQGGAFKIGDDPAVRTGEAVGRANPYKREFITLVAHSDIESP